MGLYTYEDFEKKAQEYGLSGQISEADLKLAKNNPDAGVQILNAKNDWNNATTDEGRALANARAEEARKAFGGYTGGSSGSQFTSYTPSSFSSDEGTKAQQKLNEYMNYKPFSYNPDTDDVYSSYAKAYMREGRRASEDALAQAAAMTGGIPSSYAVTAGQQAGNYYASQLADKIPELEDRAYNRYQSEKNDLLDAYQLLMSADKEKYNRHLDDIGYRQSERKYTDDKKQQDLENEWHEDDTAYNRTVTDTYIGLEVGDYSPLEKLKLTPDLEKINSTGSYFGNLREKYGRGLPSNAWDSAKDYGYSSEDLLGEGFYREWSEADKIEIKEKNLSNGDGGIESEDWTGLLLKGYRSEDLENAGFYEIETGKE